MKSIKEIMGSPHRRWPILANRTLPENAAYWQERWKTGTGIVWPFGPKGEAAPVDLPAVDAPAELAAHLDRCGLPSKFGELLGKGLNETPAVDAVARWLGSSKSLLLLHGDSGGGKTCAAASALLSAKRTLRWQGGGERIEWASWECAFETANELARMGYFSDEAHELLDYLGKVKLLILDDLGVELMNESWRSAFEALLAERFARNGCRTILTTNISAKREQAEKPSPFEVRYGARIARRIRESGIVAAVAA